VRVLKKKKNPSVCGYTKMERIMPQIKPKKLKLNGP
jgi:hypothetical protein